jgi:hypothetical protein
MAFKDFMQSIGRVVTPPKRIRDWRQQKRQYRRYLQGLGQDASAVRRGVRAWIKNNPKPKRTKGERDATLSEIPQLFREGKSLVTGNGGANGTNGFASPTITGTTGVRTAGFNPLFLLLLTPLLFPKFFKRNFKF